MRLLRTVMLCCAVVACSADPSSNELIQQGVDAQLAGNNDLAVEVLSRAIAQNDENKASALYNLGQVYQRDAQPQLAEANYLESLQVDPNYYRSAYNLGTLYRSLGRTAEALSAFQRTVSLPAVPTEVLAQAWGFQVELHTAVGQLDQAEFARSQMRLYDPRQAGS